MYSNENNLYGWAIHYNVMGNTSKFQEDFIKK